MKDTKRTVVTIIAAILLLTSVAGAGYTLYEDAMAKRSYEKSAELAFVPSDTAQNTELREEPPQTDTSEVLPDVSPDVTPDEEHADEEPVEEDPAEQQVQASTPPESDEVANRLSAIDFSALTAENPDVIGWIHIPDTDISYPIVQGTDNSRYLKYTWDGVRNRTGAIFADYRCDGEFVDFNTVVYGHKMSNGTMFGSLHKYRDPEFFDSHPYVYVATEKSVKRYRVFSCYEADTENGHSYRLGLNSPGEMSAYLNYCTENSLVKSDYSAEAGTRVITLSTCTKSTVYDYKTRLVVHGALDMEVYY